MGQRHYSTEEIAKRGREIYDTQLRAKLEPNNIGRFLVIDVETGGYEMDDDGELASIRAFVKKTQGSRYGMRIGHRTWGRAGIGDVPPIR